MERVTNILLVDDDRQEYLLIGYLLAEAQHTDYRLIWCQQPDEAMEQIARDQCDVVLLDYHWGGSRTGAEFLRQARDRGCRVPVIVMTDEMEAEVDRDAIREGASDYLIKGRIDSQLLERAIRYAIERKQIELKLDHLAHYDHLTGLPNRMLFRDRLQHAIQIAHRHQTQFALLYLDLDGFKQVNDHYGHDVGDELIRQCAERLCTCVRRSDTVARIGGDEFTVLLGNTSNVTQIAALADKLVAVLAKPFQLHQHQVNVGCSVGIAIYPEAGEEAETLQRHADLAMYQAKQQPQSCYRFFTESLNQQVSRQLVFHRELRQGVRSGQFDLLYQPRINLFSGDVEAIEVTPFWNHPQRGQLFYAEFIKPAEEGGLVTLINYWMLDRVCNDIKRLQALGCQQKMVLGIELEHLFSERFLAYIAKRLQEEGIDGENIEFEISQTIIKDGIGPIKRGIERLKQLNINVGLNHFGSGYSSFLHLQKLPIKTLKIDSDFIIDAPQNGDDSNLVAALIYLAHSLNKVIVATGVESVDHHQLLRALQCDQAQGGYYQSDLTFDELRHYFVGDIEDVANQ